jgi:hypothetical protein
MSRMTYMRMRGWKSHRHTWLGLNPLIGRHLSRIVGAIGLFYSLLREKFYISSDILVFAVLYTVESLLIKLALLAKKKSMYSAKHLKTGLI